MRCPHCQNDDDSMVDSIRPGFYFCLVCAKTFEANDDRNRTSKKGRKDTEEEV